MRQYNELAEQAGKANEDLLQAQGNLKARQDELAKAHADLVGAQQAEEQARASTAQFRDRVDELVSAAFQGARLNQLSAMLVADNPQQFLDQMTALDLLAADHKQATDGLAGALSQAEVSREQAEAARQRAQQATDAAAKVAQEVQQRKRDLETQINQVRQALNRLSGAERSALRRVNDDGDYIGPPGAANDALQAALSRRGSEYQWGAAGPSEFDCSGLTMWAYARAGISLPHSSREQYKLGKPVSQSELQPGDLLFYDDGTGNPARIHHVGMYVGDGKMVDAPTEGQLVDVRSMRGDGHYIGARRIAG
jgi:peptidoglycan DL-endopeptidase CwlO